MINLINGEIQDVSSVPIVPNGYIELYLNEDARVVAAPYGQVLGGVRNFVRFYFDASANLVTPATIWSNAELYPEQIVTPTSPPVVTYDTFYIVNVYDMNGTRLNNAPIQWQFLQAANSTVDIGTMQPYEGN